MLRLSSGTVRPGCGTSRRRCTCSRWTPSWSYPNAVSCGAIVTRPRCSHPCATRRLHPSWVSDHDDAAELGPASSSCRAEAVRAMNFRAAGRRRIRKQVCGRCARRSPNRSGRSRVRTKRSASTSPRPATTPWTIGRRRRPHPQRSCGPRPRAVRADRHASAIGVRRVPRRLPGARLDHPRLAVSACRLAATVPSFGCRCSSGRGRLDAVRVSLGRGGDDVLCRCNDVVRYGRRFRRA